MVNVIKIASKQLITLMCVYEREKDRERERERERNEEKEENALLCNCISYDTVFAEIS